MTPPTADPGKTDVTAVPGKTDAISNPPPLLSNYLDDDWDDGEYNRPRSGSKDGRYIDDSGSTLKDAHIRPDWDVKTVGDGSNPDPNVANNELRVVTGEESSGFDSCHPIVTESSMDVGRWRFDMRVEPYYFGGGNYEYIVGLISTGADFNRISPIADGWGFSIQTDANGFVLFKADSGTATEVISGGSVFSDESTHTVEITRDSSDVWELKVDGGSYGTATDSFLPDSKYMVFRARNNDGRASETQYCYMDNLVIE